MNIKQIMQSILLLLFTASLLNAKNFNESNSKIRVFESNSYTETKIETRTFNNQKAHITYDISFGSDLLGNITSVDIKILTQNLTENQKSEFIAKYKKMLEKFTSYSQDGKKNLIYPQESCVMNCISTWHCNDKPTNAGVGLCTGDCIEECYF